MRSLNSTMTKEELNSDKINYLIWRYLQESNYQGTAVKLQAEWDIVDPQSLDFAPHVQSHALVDILQRGLLFHEAQRRAAKARRHTSAGNAVGFFGPVPPLSPPLAAEEDPINARKRTSEERPQQSRQASPAKRAKLSNGYENGFVEPTPMDLDEQDTTDANSNNGHVYPSPEEIDFDHPPPPAPTTNGPEKSTQAEKPYDLVHQARCVSLASNETGLPPSLTQCEWNPKDGSRLIAIGTNMKPRSWEIADNKEQTAQSLSGIEMKSVDMLNKMDEITGSVTYVAWSTDGNSIAIASDCNDKGKITVVDEDREVISKCVSAEHPPIVSLRWNATNQQLLAITAPDNEDRSSYVTVYDLARQDTVAFKLVPGSQPTDAQWTTESRFAICDGHAVIHFEYAQGSINKLRQFFEQGALLLSYDPVSGLLAAGTDEGKLVVSKALPQVVRESSGNHFELQAHNGHVTALKWQPNRQDGVALLATSSEDNSVKIWKMGSDKSYKPLQVMDVGSCVLDLSFTPRGDFLAAATDGQVSIWDMSSSGTVPAATWTRGKEPGWQSTKQTNGHNPGELMDQHSLKWDPAGSKLAYGVNSMLAVIKFNPAQLTMNGHA